MVALVLVVMGALAQSFWGGWPPHATPAAAASLGLRVDGADLTKDGYPFLPRGFNMIGLLSPEWCTTGQGPLAAAHFGQEELDAAKGWNANTLRFQVSQRGLADPNISQDARDTYLQRVVDGVRLARSNGFMVIVSMQDQSNGCGPAHPLPSDLTLSAWSVLAPALKDDPYVMFELFNEPNVSNTTAGWAQWRDGGAGPTTNRGDPAVGHQALVGLLRGLGANNVLIADGLNKAERLAGMPLLDDAGGQLMYGIHPYYMNVSWDQQFGYLTDSAPVIATEWNFTGSACTATTQDLAQRLLPYLQDHDIGLMAHAFDVPGTTITGDWAWTPTECGTTQGGSGRLTKDYFASQSDGPTPLGAPQGLRGLAPTPTRVDLSWRHAVGAVDSYDVLRDGEVAGSTDGLTFSDTDATPGASYEYAVRAVEEDGTTGPLSTAVTVTTPAVPDLVPPSMPTGLVATATGPDEVHLSWEPATDENGIVGYEVSRGGVVIGQSSTADYDDTGLDELTTYSYTVAALDPAGNKGSASDAAQATTSAAPDVQPPSAPGNLAASVPLANEVTLSWLASTDDVAVDHYVVQRNGSVDGTTTRTSYTNGSLTPGATYDYVVTAVDAAGNTGPPATARVVNPPPPDTFAPSVPRLLAATLLAPTRASLSWQASTDNVGVTGYRVVRDGATVATVTSPGYVDNAMPSNATHTYTVRALDKAGNLSAAATSVTVIAPRPAAAGLTGKYYDTSSFSSLRVTRVDPTIDFSWGSLAPAPGMGANTFSVRWSGRIIARTNETYTFYTQSDDAVRLWVDGQRLVNSWTNHTSREDKGSITLLANRSYTIQVDYRENIGSAVARLSWSSPTVPKAVVPVGQLLAQ